MKKKTDNSINFSASPGYKAHHSSKPLNHMSKQNKKKHILYISGIHAHFPVFYHFKQAAEVQKNSY